MPKATGKTTTADDTGPTATANRSAPFEAALQEWHASTAEVHRVNQRTDDSEADDPEMAAAVSRQVAAAKRLMLEPAPFAEYLTAKLRVYAQMWTANGDATGKHGDFDVVALAAMESDVSRLFWRLGGQS